MPKNTTVLKISSDYLTQFQLPWHNYGTSIMKPKYSEESLKGFFANANPDVKMKLKIESGDDGPLVKVVYKGNKLNIPDALKACFE